MIAHATEQEKTAQLHCCFLTTLWHSIQIAKSSFLSQQETQETRLESDGLSYSSWREAHGARGWQVACFPAELRHQSMSPRELKIKLLEKALDRYHLQDVAFSTQEFQLLLLFTKESNIGEESGGFNSKRAWNSFSTGRGKNSVKMRHSSQIVKPRFRHVCIN